MRWRPCSLFPSRLADHCLCPHLICHTPRSICLCLRAKPCRSRAPQTPPPADPVGQLMARVFEGHRRDQIHVRCVDSSGAAPPVVAAATASASSTAAASSSSAASTVALSSATAATVASIATVVGGCEEAATLARDATPPQVLEPLPRQPATCLYLCSRLPRASAFQRHSTTAAGGEGGRRRLHSHPRRPQRPPQHLVRIGHQRRMGPRRWDRVSRLVGPLHALVRSTTQIRPRAAVAPSQARARLTDFAALDHPGHTEGSRPALLAARQAPVSKSHPATHTHTHGTQPHTATLGPFLRTWASASCRGLLAICHAGTRPCERSCSDTQAPPLSRQKAKGPLPVTAPSACRGWPHEASRPAGMEEAGRLLLSWPLVRPVVAV